MNGSSDPRGQGFLADPWNNRFELSILAEIGEEQENPSEALFA